MNRFIRWAAASTLCLSFVVAANAQQSDVASAGTGTGTAAVASVPRLVRFGGVLSGPKGGPTPKRWVASPPRPSWLPTNSKTKFAAN